MKNNRLVLAWVIALGLVAFGVLADLYLVYGWSVKPVCPLGRPVVIKQAQNPYQALYDDLLYPSVRITTDDGIGSGVIISYHRGTEDTENTIYILTAGHVVGNEALVNVELFGSAESLPAFVVATDTGKDLALLQICNPPAGEAGLKSGIFNGHVARLAPQGYVLHIFQPVWVIGCSLGYSPRPTSGEITAVDGSYWEMNAPIWPGNSGGGVFLKDTHELIGIAVWVKICEGQLASTMGGIVPLYEIYDFIDRLEIEGERLAVPSTGDQQPNPDNPTPQTEKWGD